MFLLYEFYNKSSRRFRFFTIRSRTFGKPDFHGFGRFTKIQVQFPTKIRLKKSLQKVEPEQALKVFNKNSVEDAIIKAVQAANSRVLELGS